MAELLILKKNRFMVLLANKKIGQYFPDIAFLSINAINYKDGFTDFRMSEIGIIKLLSQRSEKVICHNGF